MSINVNVKLFATLRDDRFKVQVMEFSEGVNVKFVTDFLNIPEDELAIILVNGQDGNIQSTLKDGDTLSLFPPVGGG